MTYIVTSQHNNVAYLNSARFSNPIGAILEKNLTPLPEIKSKASILQKHRLIWREGDTPTKKTVPHSKI